MKDVAALAGVSLKTVSRVVNREAGVSEELAARVTRAAEQLDYRPNLTASNLRRGDQRTGTIGLLVEDVANEFFSSIHRGVEEVARQRGVAVIAASLDRDPALERDLVGAFASRRVDGLILAPTASDQGYLTNEIRSGWPIVCIDRQTTGVDTDSVVTDNRAASAAGVAHLLAHGHRRIGFIGGRSKLATEQDRHAGYIDAMASAAAVVRPHWVHHGAQDSDEAMVAALAMLAWADSPTAIFSGQNLITMGTVRALRELGLAHRVALVGFDDFALADLLEPAITVVAQDARAIGHLAAELLFRRMADPSRPTATHVVPSRLIPRGSGEIRPE
ncbi:MAG: LacI family DNA-binding transcriptional regulator [Actinobacteria bacterium]|nr:LacI family DNA-binding transcriptional regulator [Actinomycetota bacterium]